MLRRARAADPAQRVLRASAPLPFADRCFDLVVLVSILTCNPDPAGRRSLLAEVQRVLAPGGIVFVSDLVLQADKRNAQRYARGAERFGRAGIFELDEGVVLTHFDASELDALFADLDIRKRTTHDVETMNGNAARVFQLLARRPLD